MIITENAKEKILILEGILKGAGLVAAGAVAADAYHKGGAYGKGGEHITDTVIDAGKKVVNTVKESFTESTIIKLSNLTKINK